MKTRIGFGILLAAALAVSALLSLPALVSTAHQPDLTERLHGSVLPAAVVVALVLQIIGHLVRSEKHAILLRKIRPISRRQVFRGQMLGFMFNALLPFRIGEVMRAHYIGRTVEISRAAVFATILLERAVDLAAVSAIGAMAVALALLGDTPSAAFVLVLVLSGALCLLAAGALLVAYRQPHWFLVLVHRSTGLLNVRLQNRSRHVIWSFCHALRYAMPRRRVLFGYLALSATMWAAYVGSLVVVAGALRGRGASLAGILGSALAPYLGLTSWRGTSAFATFAERTSVVTAPWVAHHDRLAFASAAWLLLVVPSLVLGVLGLLHRQLVHHVDEGGGAPALANKLFRDTDTSPEFAHMLAAHFRGERIGRIVSHEESLGRFTVVKALKGGSHASTLLAWQNGVLVVKKVTLPEHASKLESQHDWLRARAQWSEIVDALEVHRSTDYVSLDIEFRPDFASFFEFLHANSAIEAWATLERMMNFVDTNVHRVEVASDTRGTLEEYIDTKAVAKVRDAAAASPDILRLMSYPHITVNGERMTNFPRIVDAIRADARMMRDLAQFGHGPIHGDLTIDNLMVEPTTGRFMLIDPNDENAISDPVVDWAKLLQSLHSGYEFLLLHDLVSVEKDRVSFEERKSAHYQYLYDRCIERLRSTLSAARFRSLLFHEALHYCRMLTYRAAINPNSAAMYYGIAVRLLNEFCAQYTTPDVPAASEEIVNESPLTLVPSE